MVHLSLISWHPGHGYLYFPNGDLQECDYKTGRANGDGIYVAVSGSELKGTPPPHTHTHTHCRQVGGEQAARGLCMRGCGRRALG